MKKSSFEEIITKTNGTISTEVIQPSKPLDLNKTTPIELPTLAQSSPVLEEQIAKLKIGTESESDSISVASDEIRVLKAENSKTLKNFGLDEEKRNAIKLFFEGTSPEKFFEELKDSIKASEPNLSTIQNKP